MRALIVVLAVLGPVVGGAVASSAAARDRPDAQMLLDLDLLRETDPRAQPAPPVVEKLRLLEFLRRLESPSARWPAPDAAPTPKRAC
jgi:hypothetical protein